ncbi:MAG: Eco57I restriction-modification methylase domain-containing protein [Anaerolineales bacterium]|nr:Eco57I restriction-modification methylase domain-containing protein [Anaerolineales bacterium]
MSKISSINTVRETFESAFDKARFVPFVKNLLNEYEDAPITRTGQYIPDAYSDYVSKYERIGKYEDGDEKRIDILIVYLKKENSIERARSMQRNFIAGYLNGNYGSRSRKDAALVAFVSPKREDWRFSLVKLEVKLDADDEGKIKLVDELTPAKRWSFLVGNHEKSHTAQRQFQPILEDIENNPTLEDLEGAFNIEKVTDEFFREYRRLFIDVKSALDKAVKANPKTKADFESKGIDTVNLAKKLMGQIVFLYYLQKKGWFGVPKDGKWGEGSKNFLRELFEKKHGDYEDFFNDVLEPLFYDALRMDRSDEDYYYKRFKCKIPFLNGGLFDPMGNYNWEKTVINLSNDLFSNKGMSLRGTKQSHDGRKIASQSTLAMTEGTGILDVFDLYNFTVNEDEPFEKEVAIDPELLGKAYEKFNAIRPDNYDEFKKALNTGKKGDESKFNKQYGVYYTPREIVHYMCQQSLINYLATELEDTVSKDDLATLIQQGENLREHEARAESNPSKKYKPIISEEIREHAVMVDNKLAAIKVCDPAVGSGAFPVGMMSEIVRARDVLRTWTKTKKTIYDFKRQCIENSLYGVDIDAGAVEIAKLRLWLSLIVDEEDPLNIKPLPNLDYKIVCGNSLVGFPDNWGSSIEKEIESLIHKHFNETNSQLKNELKTQINEKIDSRYKNSLKAFGYQINFDFKTVFSVVFQQNGGFDIVIANPPYIDSERMVGKGLLELRKTIAKTYKLTKGNWDIYIAFFEKGFNLLNSKGTLIFITPDKWISKPFGDALRISKISNFAALLKAGRAVFEDAKVDAIVSMFSNVKQEYIDVYLYETEIVLKGRVQKKELNSPYTLDALFSSGLELIQKIDDTEVRLSDNFLCENACATSDAYKLKPFVRENKGDTLNSAMFFKVVNTGTIGKYFSKWALRPMVYLGDDYTCPVIKRDEFFKNFNNSYSNKTLRPKLIMKGLNLLDAFLDDDGTTIPGKTTLVITNKDNNQDELIFLLAVINSSLIFYYIKEKYSSSSYNQGTTFTKDMINGIPFPKINGNIRKKIVSTVDRILAAKGGNPPRQGQRDLRQADTSALEREIDQLVYELYGLSAEEIDIVKGR